MLENRSSAENGAGTIPQTRSTGALRLLPFMQWLPRVSGATLGADAVAALTGAVIALPQAVAYALIAGLPPQYGLYTAIVPAIVAALFGSSYHNVTGPTAANSIVVLAMVGALVPPSSPDYIPTVLTLTLLVGVFQLACGLLRFGTLVNFISDTVVVGFTAGAAALIAASQLKHVLGVNVPNDLSFAQTVLAVGDKLPYTNFFALLVAAATIGITLLVQRLRPSWPGMFIGVICGSLASAALHGASHGVGMLGSMPSGLPHFSVPTLSFDKIRALTPSAVAIGILALVQGVSVARAVASRSGQRIDGNQEFIGLGLANLIGSLFSSYAASGSFTRSGANYDAGAKTPLAAIFSAIILGAILITMPDVTRFLPMPAMAGAVLIIAWNLVDRRRIAQIMRVSREEAIVLIVTFIATLTLALEFAIYAGVLLSLVLYLRRSARPKMVGVAPVPGRPGNPLRNAIKHKLPECRLVKILRIDGSLFFGSASAVQSELERLTNHGYRYVLIAASGVDSIDFTAAEMVVGEARRFDSLGGGLYFSNLKDSAAHLLRHPDFRDAIGEDHLFASAGAALAEIFRREDATPCEACPIRLML